MIFWLVLQFCFMVVFVVVSVLLVLLTVYRGFKDDILLTIVFVFATGKSH